MGTISTVTGQFEIVPPFNAKSIRKFPDETHGRTWNTPEVALSVESLEEETEYGFSIKLRADMLSVVYETGKHSNIEAQLADIANIYGYDHKFYGYLEWRSEDLDKLPKRYYIRNSRLVIIEPTVTWEEPK
jgi:hypothetical protein